MDKPVLDYDPAGSHDPGTTRRNYIRATLALMCSLAAWFAPLWHSAHNMHAATWSYAPYHLIPWSCLALAFLAMTLAAIALAISNQSESRNFIGWLAVPSILIALFAAGAIIFLPTFS